MPVPAHFEKISAVASDGQGGKRCPARIEALFAAADVTVPSVGVIPIGKVDLALKGRSVEERLQIKVTLRQLGLID